MRVFLLDVSTLMLKRHHDLVIKHIGAQRGACAANIEARAAAETPSGGGAQKIT